MTRRLSKTRVIQQVQAIQLRQGVEAQVHPHLQQLHQGLLLVLGLLMSPAIVIVTYQQVNQPQHQQLLPVQLPQVVHPLPLRTPRI